MARIGLLDEHLTNDRNSQQAFKTLPGMAHWAGSGPPGKTCGQCKEYRKNRCDKYRRMMERGGPQFGDGASACKFFVEKDAVSSVV